MKAKVTYQILKKILHQFIQISLYKKLMLLHRGQDKVYKYHMIIAWFSFRVSEITALAVSK